MLRVSHPAPTFTLPDARMTPVRLEDFKGKQNVVLYFYPRDDTPGCTIEANQFTALADEFARAETVVIGVSRDSCASHQQFIDKYGLRVVLLADEDGSLSHSYGVLQEKEKDGVKKMGIVRSTFIIDKTGTLVSFAYGVNPDGHAEEVLKMVQHIQNSEMTGAATTFDFRPLLSDWGTPDFDAHFKAEVEQLSSVQLPLQQGLAHSSYVSTEPFTAIVIGSDADKEAIHVRTGIVYSGIDAGSCCADDPTPVDTLTEYCQLQFDIDRNNGATRVTLLPYVPE